MQYNYGSVHSAILNAFDIYGVFENFYQFSQFFQTKPPQSRSVSVLLMCFLRIFFSSKATH